MSNTELKLWYETNADAWTEALPLGNAFTGSMIYGKTDKEIISLNNDKLWSGLPDKQQNSNASKYISAARKLIDDGKYVQAAELVENKMLGHYTQAYLPLGNLYIDFGHSKENVSNYMRSLSLSDALYHQSYQYNGVEYTREAFISYPDKIMALKLCSNKPASLSFSVSLDSQLRYSVQSISGDTIELNGSAPVHCDPAAHQSTTPIIYDESPQKHGVKFGALLHIDITGGKIASENGVLTITAVDSAVIYMTSATSFISYDKEPDYDFRSDLENNISSAVKYGYDALKKRHIDDYHKLFNRVRLNLGNGFDNIPTSKRLKDFEPDENDNSLTTLLFAYGRYLLISSSRGNSFAANLQGIWNDKLMPPWSCNLTVNINTQMNYWHANTTNLPECSEPLFNLLQDLRIHGSETAKAQFGCGGFCSGHNVDLWAHSELACSKVRCSYWPMGGAWLATHIFEHYQFTMDIDFLKKHYNVLREASEFCYEWLYYDEKSGYYITSPSTSPENDFIYTDEAGNKQKGSISAATTSDMAIIRELFIGTAKAAEILNIDDEFRQKLLERLEKLYPYKIGRRGRLQEWYLDFDDAEPGHRHISHLIGCHPGTHITKDKTPELFEAVHRVLELRLSNGGAYTGWSCAWTINQFARLKQGERALDFINQLLANSTYPNLFDAHPPFQIDGNFGAAAGIAEMLLQSHEGFIELLPALPRKWQTGSVEGLCARGGIEVSIYWQNGILQKAVFYTERECNQLKIRYNDKDFTMDVTPFEKTEFTYSV